MSTTSFPLSTTPPLRDLWRHAARRRPTVVAATVLSTANKLFDVLQPEQVGPIVLDGIRANRAWIFTDRNVGPAIEASAGSGK